MSGIQQILFNNEKKLFPNYVGDAWYEIEPWMILIEWLIWGWGDEAAAQQEGQGAHQGTQRGKGKACSVADSFHFDIDPDPRIRFVK